MDPQTFLKLADACLKRVEGALEDVDPDILDFNGASGLLQLEFADGTKFILNRQSGNHQMWLAAGVRAYHFDWHPETEEWRDARDGEELFARLTEIVTEKLGHPIRF